MSTGVPLPPSGTRAGLDVRKWIQKLDELLHQDNGATRLLEKAERKTGVRRLYMVLALLGFMVLALLVGYGAQFLCNFIGFMYPAYASVKAIESVAKDDDTKWLTYWVVYSAFSLVEMFADQLLFWIPFYWFIKCLFLLYCMAPIANNGSVVIYNNFIRPFVLKHAQDVDKLLGNAAVIAQDVYGQLSDVAQRGAAVGSVALSAARAADSDHVIHRQFDAVSAKTD